MDEKYLFLDIDGVLHPAGVAYITNDRKAGGDNLFRWLPKLVAVFDKYPDLKIIIHSTWRLAWREKELRDILPEWLAEKFTTVTNPEISGRWASIEDFIEKNSVTKYVILDDESGAFPYGKQELINCMSTQGLSRQSTYSKFLKKLEELYQ